jgi:hypothetical protein
VYYDGQPVLIDVGRGTYTRKTFSSSRYDIWYNCSDHHNVPTINGETQRPGAAFKASNVSFKQDRKFAELSLDISKSYPEKAGVNSWQRSIRLNRGKNVEVKDVVSLQKAEKITQHLMTCYRAEVSKPGELVIHYKPKNGEAKDFVVKYDAAQLQVAVEKISLTAMEDKDIIEKWGDNIYRVNFTVIAPKAKDKINFVIAYK